MRIAGRGIEDKDHLGRHRWVVERTISRVLRNKGLGIRYDRIGAILLHLLLLAVALINLRRRRQTIEWWDQVQGRQCSLPPRSASCCSARAPAPSGCL